HPLLAQLLSFGELDEASAEPWILLEAVDDRAGSHRPEPGATDWASLDELRNPSRANDAHLARYQLASHFVRMNDRVLDLHGASGAGAAAIARAGRAGQVVALVPDAEAREYATASYATTDDRLQFRSGSLHDVPSLEDQSVDVALHLHEGDTRVSLAQWISAVHRVLIPGGRFICSVPGTSAPGSAPARAGTAEPHACSSLLASLGASFLIERAFAQTGAVTTPSQARAWHELDPDGSVQMATADWWVIVAMKDPLLGTRDGYRERLYPGAAFPGGPNPTQYVGAFDNPWLHASVFNLGNRVTRWPLLQRVCRQIVSGRPNSSDAAAAHCVLGYRLLEADEVEGAAVEAWVRDAEASIEALTVAEPVATRWRVSLLFLAGRLLMRQGAHEQALSRLRACMAEDATRFSTLLATRTTEAAFLAGCIEARRGNLAAAAEAWSRGVAIAAACVAAERSTTAQTTAPLEVFGFREFASVFDSAGQCAAGLAALSAGRQWETRFAQIVSNGSAIAGLHARLDRAAWALDDARKELAANTARVHALESRLNTANIEALHLRVHLHVAESRARRHPIVVWGAGAGGRRAAMLVGRFGGRVAAFVDSDPAKAGSVVAGATVMTPDRLPHPEWRNAFVLVASVHAVAIEAQLKEMELGRPERCVRLDIGALLAADVGRHDESDAIVDPRAREVADRSRSRRRSARRRERPAASIAASSARTRTT
ncbi:MAG: methyltransferase domain-containing protein, partial [Vicinamibacterales bacterium]